VPVELGVDGHVRLVNPHFNQRALVHPDADLVEDQQLLHSRDRGNLPLNAVVRDVPPDENRGRHGRRQVRVGNFLVGVLGQQLRDSVRRGGGRRQQLPDVGRGGGGLVSGRCGNSSCVGIGCVPDVGSRAVGVAQTVGVKEVADGDGFQDAVRAVESVHGVEPGLVGEVLVVAGGRVGVGLLLPLAEETVLDREKGSPSVHFFLLIYSKISSIEEYDVLVLDGRGAEVGALLLILGSADPASREGVQVFHVLAFSNSRKTGEGTEGCK
jgi:hypothetical protein